MLPDPATYAGWTFKTLSGVEWEKCYTIFVSEDTPEAHWFWRAKEVKRRRRDR